MGRPAKKVITTSSEISKPQTIVEKPQEIKVVKTRSRKKINNDIEIRFKNNTTGIFIYVDSKTQIKYELQSFGDYDYITYGELFNMKNKNNGILTNYWIILEEVIENEDDIELSDVLDQLGLTKKYEAIEDVLDIEYILNNVSNEKFMDLFLTLPKEYLTIIAETSTLLFRQGKFNDHSKMQYIQNLAKLDDMYS